ncbi:MAG: DUF4124 domain-containing protein [Marinagarivorans sp.]
MRYFLFALMSLPCFAFAQVYKCIHTNGKVAFSDKPCPNNTAQSQIKEKTEKADWVSRLLTEKSSAIIIIDVIRKNDEVSILYKFKTQQESNEFLQLANKLSNIPVVLLKYIAPTTQAPGSAELKASKKIKDLPIRTNPPAQ